MSRPGLRLPTVTLYADRHEIQTAFDKARHPWICLTCGKQFDLMNNMGGLECRQHPGFIQDDERWSCCGQKIYRVQYVRNRTHLRTLSCTVGKTPYNVPPKVPGCQRCDHNTSQRPYSHKDAQSIADLSALLPFMNKKFPFQLRDGFDNGLLRRCEIRKLHYPPKPTLVHLDQPYLKTILEFIANDGHLETFEYDAFEKKLIQYGLETSATHVYGTEDDFIEVSVKRWWSSQNGI